MIRPFKTKWLALGLAAAFVMLILPFEALALGQEEAKTGSLIGFIYYTEAPPAPAGEGTKLTPVANAVIKLRNIDTGKEYVSDPTDENGAYSLEGIQAGRYVLGITTGLGDYNFSYEVLIKTNEVGKLSLGLTKEEEKEGAAAFFKKPAGIAVIVVASGVVIYGTYKLLEALDIISPNKKK
jgi:hypothetical protein